MRRWFVGGLLLSVCCAPGAAAADAPAAEAPAGAVATPTPAEPAAIAGLKRLGGRLLVKGADPSWSSDGKRLVFCEGARLKVFDLDGGAVRDLATSGRAPAWAPGDGRQIAYVAGNGAAAEIWLVDAAGGSPHRLIAGNSPAWAADGRTLFLRAAAKARVQSFPVDARDDTAATDLVAVGAEYAAVSADGRRVAYRKGNQLNVLAGDTGKTLRTWPVGGAGFLGRWSADGKRLAFGGRGSDDPLGLWVLDVEQGRAVRVAEGACTMPAWSADGAHLACTVFVGKESEIWSVPVKRLAALPAWAPATDRCGVPEGAAELVGPWHNPKGNLVQLDLGAHANQKRGDRFSPTDGNDLRDLPDGEQTLAGIKFRVAERVIQLAGTRLPEAPPRAEGIPVQRRAIRLYFLQGTQWGATQFGVPDGTPIGRYRIHYTDGCRATVPVVCGQHVRDWWSRTSEHNVSQGQVAWVGRNAAAQRSSVYLRLYLTVWENPHPEKTIAHLDFSSAMTVAAPFCVAITAEEPRN